MFFHVINREDPSKEAWLAPQEAPNIIPKRGESYELVGGGSAHIFLPVSESDRVITLTATADHAAEVDQLEAIYEHQGSQLCEFSDGDRVWCVKVVRFNSDLVGNGLTWKSFEAEFRITERLM